MATKTHLEQVKADAKRIQLRRMRDEAEDKAAREAELEVKTEKKTTKKSKKED